MYRFYFGVCRMPSFRQTENVEPRLSPGDGLKGLPLSPIWF
jgi:hypothetical protein